MEGTRSRVRSVKKKDSISVHPLLRKEGGTLVRPEFQASLIIIYQNERLSHRGAYHPTVGGASAARNSRTPNLFWTLRVSCPLGARAVEGRIGAFCLELACVFLRPSSHVLYARRPRLSASKWTNDLNRAQQIVMWRIER